MSWLFSEEYFLSQCPSRKQLTLPQDLKTRESIYDFTIKLGSALKLNGKTILAATVYVARFYMRMPITTSKYFVVCAAITISCKLHDNYRQPDKIAMTACQIKNPHKKIDEQSSTFWQWRDQLLYREELMLKTLNFDLNLDLPYELRDRLLSMKEFQGERTENKEQQKNGQNGHTCGEKLHSDCDDDKDGDEDDKYDTDFDVAKLVGNIDDDHHGEDPDVQENGDADEKLSLENRFYRKGSEYFKQAISLIEILASLPILVCYDIEAFFGAALVIILLENQPEILPKDFLNVVGTTTEKSYKCYKYIYELLKIGSKNSDPHLNCNAAAAKRIRKIEKDEFFRIAN